MPTIYLDHNATTPLDPRVLDVMHPYLSRVTGNPSSIHATGRATREAVEHARRTVAATLHARPDEMIFTSGATEANNLALRGVLDHTQPLHIVTSAIEHPSVMAVIQAMEQDGVEVTYVPVDSTGYVAPQDVRAALRPQTALISIMAANNEVGTLQPIQAIGAAARERQITFHVDAAQAFGRVPIDVQAWQADLITLSGHKAHGPQGVGALYVRRGLTLTPLMRGGTHEQGRRPGTESVAGIVGFGETAHIIQQDLTSDVERIKGLRDLCERTLMQRVPEVQRNGHATARLCNTLNVRYPGLSGEALAIHLDLAGVAVSTGAACSSGRREPSPVLLAMGQTSAEATEGVRMSLGRFTTEHEVMEAVQVFTQIIEQLRHHTVQAAVRGPTTSWQGNT